MSCQKVVNVLAVASAAVSVAVVGSGLYVYVNRDSIINGVKQQAIDAALGSLGNLGGMGGATELPLGTNDLSPTALPAAGPALPEDSPRASAD